MSEYISQEKKTQREELSREEENVLYRVGLVIFPIVLVGIYIMVYWILPSVPTGDCIFWSLTGAYCPGCGGTRAVIALAHGKILRSIWYHPLVMYTVVFYMAYMITHTLEKLHIPFIRGMRFRSLYLYIAMGIIAVNCIVKNVLLFGFGIAM